MCAAMRKPSRRTCRAGGRCYEQQLKYPAAVLWGARRGAYLALKAHPRRRAALRSLRPRNPAAIVFTRPISTLSKPHARGCEGHADRFLYVVQNNRANHCKHDCREAGGDENAHSRFPCLLIVQSRIASLVISSACRCSTRRGGSAVGTRQEAGCIRAPPRHLTLERRTCVSR